MIVAKPSRACGASQVVADVVSATAAHGRAAGWPTLVYNVGDEPHGDNVAASVAAAAAFRRAGALTSVFTSLVDGSAETAPLLDGAVDLAILTHHSAYALRRVANASARFMTYNLGDRYGAGVYQFRLRAEGCLGHYQFAFSSVGADPYYALDAREDDIVAAFTHGDGRLRPTLQFELYREGLTDLRYALLAERLAAPDGPAATAGAPAAAVARAAAAVARLRALPVGHETQRKSSLPTAADLRALRAELADLLTAACPARNCSGIPITPVPLPTPPLAQSAPAAAPATPLASATASQPAGPISTPAPRPACELTAGWEDLVALKVAARASCPAGCRPPCGGACGSGPLSGGLGQVREPGRYEVRSCAPPLPHGCRHSNPYQDPKDCCPALLHNRNQPPPHGSCRPTAGIWSSMAITASGRPAAHATHGRLSHHSWRTSQALRLEHP
jgi:hypothetical protein